MNPFLEITSNQPLTHDIYQMELKGEACQKISEPGQFVNIKLSSPEENLYLRRPMSVCDYDKDYLKIIYKVVGKGTKLMTTLTPGTKLDVLTGLGHGFPMEEGLKKALLIGGGVGVPPLYNLAKQLHAKGVEIEVVLGFNSKIDVFYEEEFKQFGKVYVATMDGTYGDKGTAIDVMKKYGLTYDKYYSCGPEKMLNALVKNDPVNGYLSYEARMGCGFGACMGCSCHVKGKPYKRVCVEGPVLEASEVIIDE